MALLKDLPNEYRKPILIGYFSVILLISDVILNFIFINEGWRSLLNGMLILGIMITVGLFGFYFIIITLGVEDKKVKRNVNLIIGSALIILGLNNFLIH